MSVLDKVRKWIDGDSAETVLEEAARDAQVQPRSAAEGFIVKIAKAVEEVMQREIVPLPQGTTIIPTEYTIFLSEGDDKEWQGAKRRGLEQGLYHILAERAKEIAGKRKLETKSFAVELRVDGTLEKGDLRVSHSWEEDSSSNKTGVLTRPKNLPEIKSPPPQQQQQQATKNENFPAPNFTANQPFVDSPPIPQTIQQSNFSPFQNNQAAAAKENGESDAEEMTHVQKRAQPELFRLEIWRDGTRQNVMPIYQPRISIGRGSKSQTVDVALAGDPEISRRHLTLTLDERGNFTVLNEGRNPALINNREINNGQTAAVEAGNPIGVCSYLLRIQPK